MINCESELGESCNKYYFPMWLLGHRKTFKELLITTSFLTIALIGLCVACSQANTGASSLERTVSEDCQNTSSQNIEQLIYLAETAENSQENAADVEQLWRDVIRLEPSYIEAYYRLGSHLYLQGLDQQSKLDQAVEVYRQAIQRYPEVARSHYDLGRMLLAQQKLPEAIASYRQAIRLDPRYAMQVDWFALSLPLDQVILALTQEIEAARGPAAINYLLLGDAFRQARHTNQAMELGQQNFPDLCQQYLQGCPQQYVVLSDQELDVFQNSIRLDPQSAVAYETLGISLYELERYDEAVSAFRQAIQINPQSDRVYYRLGIVLLAQDNTSEAVQAFYQAAQVNPNYTGIDSGFWWLRLNYYRGQLHEQAIAALQQELQAEPSAVGYYILGNVLAGLHIMDTQPDGRDQAIEALHQAIQLQPRFAKAHARLGYIQMIQNRTEEAEQALRQAIQLDPALMSAYDNLRNLLRTQQRFAEAEQIFCARQSIIN
ncbi:MAG: tetratricopeptide repeat protein [Leptolyngbya sp. DLM2.Bin15]|nr:MAG: tetratricopeptide repeat protein [Leptolyngbya sp. DLM2.Bin15]